MQLLTNFPTSTVETKFELDKKSSTKHNTIPCANLILRLNVYLQQENSAQIDLSNTGFLNKSLWWTGS